MEYAIANFCCPITGRLMRDPVITRWGNNFERSAIMRSVESSGMDPVAQRPLRNPGWEISENALLRRTIQECFRFHVAFGGYAQFDPFQPKSYSDVDSEDDCGCR